MEAVKFFVEGRWFDDPLSAFTFAWIQADRMLRAVEIRLGGATGPWHGTAQPSNYVRSHKVADEVKTAPMELPLSLVAVR